MSESPKLIATGLSSYSYRDLLFSYAETTAADTKARGYVYKLTAGVFHRLTRLAHCFNISKIDEKLVKWEARRWEARSCITYAIVSALESTKGHDAYRVYEAVISQL